MADPEVKALGRCFPAEESEGNGLAGDHFAFSRDLNAPLSPIPSY